MNALIIIIIIIIITVIEFNTKRIITTIDQISAQVVSTFNLQTFCPNTGYTKYCNPLSVVGNRSISRNTVCKL